MTNSQTKGNDMKNYYRLMLGRKSMYAGEAYEGKFIGVGFLYNTDLNAAPNDWEEFRKKYIPKLQEKSPGKSKIVAGLACGAMYKLSKGIKLGDIVLCPNGEREYYVGEIIGGYQYCQGRSLPHQRSVRWYSHVISRNNMSKELEGSTGSIATINDITKHAQEIESLIKNISSSTEQETASAFALEKHLEEYMVKNWDKTELSENYNIYEEDGKKGQQYNTVDAGTIDILAISKDKKELLVVELKKGRTSDDTVGQILRYMGYVKKILAEDDQKVSGVIIAYEDDKKIRYALSVIPDVKFFTYKISFSLEKKL